MRCRHCQAEVVETAKFCHQRGRWVKKGAGLGVKQKAKVVTGTRTVLVAGEGVLPADIQVEVEQTIYRMEGVVMGIALGSKGGSVHVGGEQQYIAPTDGV